MDTTMGGGPTQSDYNGDAIQSIRRKINELEQSIRTLTTAVFNVTKAVEKLEDWVWKDNDGE